MSRLSVHISSGNRRGFGDWLAMAKPSLIFSVNENIGGDIAQKSPSTQWVYRRQSGTFNRLPPGFFAGDPVASATNWLTVTRDPSDKNRTQIENILLNNPDYASVDNEPVPDTPEKAQWYNAWLITALEICHSHGVKLAMCSFPTAGPPYEMWQHLLPALRLGKQYGAILSLHAYQDTSLLLKNPDGAYTEETLNQTLRHRKIYGQYVPVDAQLPIVYSEASPDNGYGMGLFGQAWISDMGAYDTELFRDPYIVSICGYQLGGQESNMVDALANYGQYIASHPTPINAESPDNTVVPPTSSITDNKNHIWALGAPVVHGYALLRDGVQFAGGQGVLLLYYSHRVYTKNDTEMWYIAGETSWTQVPGDPRISTPVRGIDVSFYQGTIDWRKVKTEKQFAFIKATQSSNIRDSRFYDNWAGSRTAGIPRGAYHYYKFNAYHMAQLSNIKLVMNSVPDKGELPFVVDIEDENFVSIYCQPIQLEEFLAQVTRYFGRKPLIYTAKWWTNKYPQYLPVLTQYDLYVADYAHTSPTLPAGFTTWKFWQYSSTGQVSGISGNVDMDIFNGNKAQFDAYLNAEPVPPPVSTAKAGLHMAARGGDQTPQDWQAFDTAKLQAIKFMSNHALNDIKAGVQRVSASSVYFRMYADPNDANAMSSGTSFFNVHRGWLDQLYAIGVYNWEIHNEPNLNAEGNGVYWQGSSGFSAWYRECARLIRQYYPKARIIYPGLSPQPDVVPYWKPEIQILINEGLVDLVGCHSYWQTPGSESWGMLALDGGQYYQNFLGMGRNLVLTEASNNNQTTGKTTKGNQYVQYLKTIKAGVDAVLFFVSSTGNPAYNSEAWVGSQIPSIVGARQLSLGNLT